MAAARDRIQRDDGQLVLNLNAIPLPKKRTPLLARIEWATIQ